MKTETNSSIRPKVIWLYFRFERPLFPVRQCIPQGDWPHKLRFGLLITYSWTPRQNSISNANVISAYRNPVNTESHCEAHCEVTIASHEPVLANVRLTWDFGYHRTLKSWVRLDLTEIPYPRLFVRSLCWRGTELILRLVLRHIPFSATFAAFGQMLDMFS